MSTLLLITGLLIAIAIFLHFINAVDGTKRPGQSQGADAQKTIAQTGTKQTKNTSVINNDIKDFLPERRCPLCSMTLKRDEPLYASFIEAGGTKRVLIHGCPYCYKGEKRETI